MLLGLHTCNLLLFYFYFTLKLSKCNNALRYNKIDFNIVTQNSRRILFGLVISNFFLKKQLFRIKVRLSGKGVGYGVNNRQVQDFEGGDSLVYISKELEHIDTVNPFNYVTSVVTGVSGEDHRTTYCRLPATVCWR